MKEGRGMCGVLCQQFQFSFLMPNNKGSLKFKEEAEQLSWYQKFNFSCLNVFAWHPKKKKLKQSKTQQTLDEWDFPS